VDVEAAADEAIPDAVDAAAVAADMAAADAADATVAAAVAADGDTNNSPGHSLLLKNVVR